MITPAAGNESTSHPPSDPPFDLFARLKAETAVIHQQTEARVPVFEPEFDLAAYVRLLERFYGYWVPIEAEFVKIPALHHADLDLAGRLKTALLMDDLRILGRDPAAVPLCDRLPPVDTLARALGCLYVLEGSSLGARFISRRLAEHLELSSTNGASFFNAYGGATGERWSQFKAFAIPRVGEDDASEAIESARETFQYFYDWLGA